MTSIFVMLYINCGSLLCEYADAPHAGARIEIRQKVAGARPKGDAPHAGARIEIQNCITVSSPQTTPPTRGRELK